MWGLKEQLLAALVDQGNINLWLKARAAGKRLEPPQQIPRPGVEPTERIGDKPMSIAEMNKGLGWEVRDDLPRIGSE